MMIPDNQNARYSLDNLRQVHRRLGETIEQLERQLDKNGEVPKDEAHILINLAHDMDTEYDRFCRGRLSR